MQKLPAVIFLFGPSGAGKSFAGKIISDHLNWPIYEADEDISDAMQEALDNKQPFTQAMRDEFFPRVINRIQQLLSDFPHLIVTQGLYKQANRNYLKAQLPELQLICVQADKQVITDRLLHRKAGIDLQSANALINDFEPPPPDIPLLLNNGSIQDIKDQLGTLLPTLSL